MKTIKINHIAKTEGHLSFIGSLLGGDFAHARLETLEGARLIEGIMLGRQYFEAPVITSRICGVCPIVHNLTSIKAMEQALHIKINQEILILRKMLINAQWIHSHALHAFFLSFPDIIGVSNNFDFIKKHPEQANLALQIRNYGVELARILGGRTVHPINSVIGGFNVAPDDIELKDVMKDQAEILDRAIKMFSFISKFKLPKFERPTNYVSLKKKNEYAIYDGEVYFSDNQELNSPEQFFSNIRELILPYEKVKRVEHLDRSFMVGALARVNNNFEQLNPEAKKAWQKLKIKLPCYNPFYNIWAQAVEIIHSIEEMSKLFQQYEKLKSSPIFEKNLKIEFESRSGKGLAVMEAPRGVLFHEYELADNGEMTNTNIIAPTTMFLGNLEKDLQEYLPQIKNLAKAEQELLIKTLTRAYDPCISCATH